MTNEDAPPLRDVAIVGGGPVGMLLACLLLQRGIDAVVLERRPVPATRPRAFGVHPPGLAVLDAAGVGDAVRAAAAVIRVGTASSAGRTLARIPFAARPIRSLEQDRTEAILRARLGELDPRALHPGAEVTTVRDLGDRVELGVADETGEARHAARLVVGADGIRSVVRAAIGAAWLPRRGAGEYAMADTRRGAEPADVAVLRLEPAGVVESFPLPLGGRRWVARLPARPDVLDPAAFAGIVESRTGVRLDLDAMSPPSLFTARQHVARPFARGRIALVGDAAHELSPIGGQGMNLGWLDAARLDAAIAAALAGRAPAAQALARYAAERRAAAGRAMRRAAFNMAMGAEVSGVSRLGRDALVGALGLPGLRRLFADAFAMRGL